MRRLVLSLGLLVILTGVVSARSTQNPDAGSSAGGAGGACNALTGKLVLATALSGSGALGTAPAASSASATPGLMQCSQVQATCTGTFTKLACSVSTGSGTTQSECGLFTASGATRIASTGPQSTAAAATLSATVTAFTLTSGTNYLACFASTGVGAAVQYRALGTATAFHNQFVNTCFAGGSLATQRAPMNDECTAGSTPYTCCSGVKAGTCNGMADRTGVPGVAATAVMGPLMAVAP